MVNCTTGLTVNTLSSRICVIPWGFKHWRTPEGRMLRGRNYLPSPQHTYFQSSPPPLLIIQACWWWWVDMLYQSLLPHFSRAPEANSVSADRKKCVFLTTSLWATTALIQTSLPTRASLIGGVATCLIVSMMVVISIIIIKTIITSIVIPLSSFPVSKGIWWKASLKFPKVKPKASTWIKKCDQRVARGSEQLSPRCSLPCWAAHHRFRFPSARQFLYKWQYQPPLSAYDLSSPFVILFFLILQIKKMEVLSIQWTRGSI